MSALRVRLRCVAGSPGRRVVLVLVLTGALRDVRDVSADTLRSIGRALGDVLRGRGDLVCSLGGGIGRTAFGQRLRCLACRAVLAHGLLRWTPFGSLIGLALLGGLVGGPRLGGLLAAAFVRSH